MEGDQGEVPRRFTEDLVRLRQRAGQPSYSTLERLSKHKLKRATVSDVLKGNRVNLPDWRFVAEFVDACRAAAAESGLNADELGTRADWNRHWDAAFSGVIDARFPGHGYQSLTWQESPNGAQSQLPASPLATDQPEVDASGSVDALTKATRTGPTVWGPLPARLPYFVGRESLLGGLRDALAKGDRTGAVAIQGLFGVGKTQLVIEYARRYSHEYDLVWWLPGDATESAFAAMADLAAELGLAGAARPGAEGDYAELFDVLRRGERYKRWLLIFDNANEPEEIKDLIPPVSPIGHVLVTTRSSHWEAFGELVELNVFDRAESIEFLSRQMRRFNAVAAHRLAEGVGDLPLLLEHAVESHVAIDTYLERLDEDPIGLLDDQPADYQANIASEWRKVLDKLRADAPDAFDLLRCLAFFGGDPVPRESLERGSYLTDVSIYAMLRDPFRRLGAIKKLRRAGLLRVRAGTGSFEVHRVTRCIVRDMVARASADDEERARHDVHLLLAAADPFSPNDPATWQSYGELCRHATESGTAACCHEIVRKFVVNLVRSLNAAGDARDALDVADGALAHWDENAVADSARAADSHVTMCMAKADALFAYGKHEEAFSLWQQALAAMRLDPHKWAAEIIQLDSISASRLRIMGKFREAQATDQESVRAHVAEFGDDDPRTFVAVNSLIADLAINGSCAEAARTAERLYRDCHAYYSDARHPAVLAERNVLGRCLWLSGQYSDAVAVIAEVRAGYAALVAGGMIDKNHPWCLANHIDYAIARRDKGLMPPDIQTLADDMQDVRGRCWRTLGADHPLTLAASIALGSLLRRISGRAGEAARLLEDAERRYQSALPDHPYGFACTGFLAAVRCQAAGNGSPQQVATQSIQVLQDAVERLAGSVGEAHPLSLTAVGALANALARSGELDAALERGQSAQAGSVAVLGPDHPHTLAFEANAATVRSRLRNEPAPEDFLSRYATTLGPGHPDIALFAEGHLVDIDFTPLPL